jgi:hypothetical protein
LACDGNQHKVKSTEGEVIFLPWELLNIQRKTIVGQLYAFRQFPADLIV